MAFDRTSSQRRATAQASRTSRNLLSASAWVPRQGSRGQSRSSTSGAAPRCSWLNAVEGFFSKLTRQALRRGVFRSVDDSWPPSTGIEHANDDPKPIRWTASAASTTAKLRLKQPRGRGTRRDKRRARLPR
ncbi:hypothetical protein D3272_13350 [Lichenibacterium ramalinae]|uniref:Transposase n=1 Tax=Lichenibacterium ramalinae TaxID=2316527 RepID=A0A4Q2RFQ6_9HYPH|nr:hypothetical protein D3272_13350 [Lichenibacterium ramalinae]